MLKDIRAQSFSKSAGTRQMDWTQNSQRDKFISNYRNSGNDVCKLLCAN